MEATGVSRNLVPIYQTIRCLLSEDHYVLRDLGLVSVHKMTHVLYAFPVGGDTYCGLLSYDLVEIKWLQSSSEKSIGTYQNTVSCPCKMTVWICILLSAVGHHVVLLSVLFVMGHDSLLTACRRKPKEATARRY
jgi:hypothetical protein